MLFVEICRLFVQLIEQNFYFMKFFKIINFRDKFKNKTIKKLKYAICFYIFHRIKFRGCGFLCETEIHWFTLMSCAIIDTEMLIYKID